MSASEQETDEQSEMVEDMVADGAEVEAPADGVDPGHASPDAAADATESPVEESEEEETLDMEVHLKPLIEALLFAAEEPVTRRRLGYLTGVADKEVIQAALSDIQGDYQDTGIQLQSVAGGYQFRTNPLYSKMVQKLVAGRPVRLTRSQTETLAIVAYRQPITRPEIDDIRGVDSGGTLRTLLDRSLIRVLGKKQEPGRPLLYGTTKDFLQFFNLEDLSELPTLREFSELTDDSAAEVERRGHDVPEPAEIAAAVAAQEQAMALEDEELGEEPSEVALEDESVQAAALDGDGHEAEASDADAELDEVGAEVKDAELPGEGSEVLPDEDAGLDEEEPLEGAA